MVQVDRGQGWMNLMEVESTHYKTITSHIQDLFQFPEYYDPPYYLPVRIPLANSEMRIDVFHEIGYWQIDFLEPGEERNSRQPQPSQQTSGVKGSLEDMGVGEVIQIMSMGRKTQMLLLHHSEGDARLYLEAGQIVHAEMPPYEGFDVIPHVLRWHVGTFEILPMDKPPKKTITQSTEHVLLDASRMLDES